MQIKRKKLANSQQNEKLIKLVRIFFFTLYLHLIYPGNVGFVVADAKSLV